MRHNVVTAHHLVERLRWWLERIRRRRAQWRTILFSNESRFKLFRTDGQSRIYRRHNEHYTANVVLEQARLDDGSVMVWTVIHYDGRIALVRINGALNAQIY